MLRAEMARKNMYIKVRHGWRCSCAVHVVSNDAMWCFWPDVQSNMEDPNKKARLSHATTATTYLAPGGTAPARAPPVNAVQPDVIPATLCCVIMEHDTCVPSYDRGVGARLCRHTARQAALEAEEALPLVQTIRPATHCFAATCVRLSTSKSSCHSSSPTR